MKNNLPKNPVKLRREQKRIAKLAKEGRVVQGVEIPEGALPADPSRQAHSAGYSVKFYYQDVHYACAGCGKQEVWTAQQQKKYFEVQKGNIYNEAKWCHACHVKRMQDKQDSVANSE